MTDPGGGGDDDGGAALADGGAIALGAAAHEIKNALSPLGMTLQLAERQLLAGGAVAAADIAFARAQVRRLARLVDDLMDVTRVELDQLALAREPCDLRAVVGDAVDAFRRAHAGAAAVAVELPAAAVSTWADAGRLQQVLANLLENAARYAPTGTPIAVSLARGAAGVRRARIAVRDEGPGLSADEQRRVFGRFERGGAAAGTRGLGLGLYLSRAIVERHGGAIGVDSAPGRGASFWIELDASE